MAYHDITDINLSYVQHPILNRRLRLTCSPLINTP